MTEKRKVLLGLFIGVFCVLMPSISMAATIGVSPVEYHYDYLLPNTELTDVVYFTRQDTSKEEVVGINAEGVGSEAIVLLDGDQFVLPKGNGQVSYRFGVRPGSLPSGEYQVYLRTYTQQGSRNGEFTGSGLLHAGKALITFRVINYELSKWDIISGSIDDVEFKQPISFGYRLKNTGNVKARPTHIVFNAVEVDHPSNVYEETIKGVDIPFTDPYSTSDHSIETRAELEPATYHINIDFFDNEEFKYNLQKDIEVFPEGTFSQEGEFVEYSTPKGEYVENELVSLNGVFKNTGNVQYKAHMVSDIIKGDHKLDFIKSEPLLVKPGQVVDFQNVFRPDQFGEYTSDAHVVFGVSKSETKTTAFSVIQTGALPLALLLSFMTVLFGGILFLFYKKRNKGERRLSVGAYCEYNPYQR